MKRSRFDEVAGVDVPDKTWSRYGVTDVEWGSMTPDQRALHYNRQNVCDHPYVYTGPDNDDIRSSHSFDPYAHTAHLMSHSPDLFFKGLCDCQTCDGKFGIPRDQERRKAVDVDVLRQKLHPRKAAE